MSTTWTQWTTSATNASLDIKAILKAVYSNVLEVKGSGIGQGMVLPGVHMKVKSLLQKDT